MRIHSAVVLLVALLAISSPAAGQVRSPVPAAPKWSAVDQAVGKENYLEAKKQADAVLQRGTPEDRQKTMLVYGRILLGLGQKEQARQYLNMLSGGEKSSGRKGRQLPSPSGRGAGGEGTQQAIYTAWLKAFDKPDEAIKTLEKMLEQAGSAPDETTAEAADVLAMLYMARGEHDKAKKAVDLGLKILKYRGTKGGYVLALLRGRLKSDFTAGEAKRLYNEAEKLREKGKFVEAGQLFAQVRAMYPKNQWGHASGFRIGQCFLGLNQPAKAIDWWQKFIKESPAGPWRAQAYVALVDVTLESLDLKKATEYALAASAVLGKLGEKGTVPLREAGHRPEVGQGLSPSSPEDAEPSWKEAAYDIHLRQGIVSLVDGRFDAAVQGFQQAKQSVGDCPNFRSTKMGLSPSAHDVQAGLDRLIEAAQNRVKLIPDELTVGDDRATVALVLGNIYNILRQYDVAKGWFSLPLNGSLRSRSAGHRSFAGLGLARAVIASDQPISSPKSVGGPKSVGAAVELPHQRALLQAKTMCEASLAEYPKGSWHDETLRELALLIERAANESGQSSVASGQKGANPKSPNPAPLSDATRQQQKKTLLAARAQALPYWFELSKRYPTSRHMPQALYHAGVLYTEAATGGLSRFSSDENGTVPLSVEKALTAFEELAKKYPDSPWTGDAHVRLIDVKLEHQFDLPGARNHADAAVAWYERLDQAKAAQARKGIGEEQSDALRSVKQLGYDIYVRAGLVEYLLDSGKGDCPSPSGASPQGLSPFPRAAAFFEKAKPFQPERNFVVVQGTIPTGIERLIEAAKSNKSLTPEVVRKGDEKAKLILMLADVYLEGQQWQKTLELCELVIHATRFPMTPDQKSWAHHQRATAIYGIPDCKNAHDDYVLAQRTCPNAPWAARSLFEAGCISSSFIADRKQAVNEFVAVVKRYPKSDIADKAGYFVGVTCEWDNQPDRAKLAYNWFLKRHPDSPWTGLVKHQHLPAVEKQLEATKPSNTRRTKP
jgi:tetratricopeptide (TPR) repeat protein